MVIANKRWTRSRGADDLWERFSSCSRLAFMLKQVAPCPLQAADQVLTICLPPSSKHKASFEDTQQRTCPYYKLRQFIVTFSAHSLTLKPLAQCARVQAAVKSLPSPDGCICSFPTLDGCLCCVCFVSAPVHPLHAAFIGPGNARMSRRFLLIML